MAGRNKKATIGSQQRAEAIGAYTPFVAQQQTVTVVTAADIAASTYNYSREEMAFLNNILWLDPSSIDFPTMLEEIIKGFLSDSARTWGLISAPTTRTLDDIVWKLPQYDPFENRYAEDIAKGMEEPEGTITGFICGFNGCTWDRFKCKITQTRSADEGMTFSSTCTKCKHKRTQN